ncbi:2-phosphosulfolactate phosphatase [Methanocaldococcus villosus KIN24-T80]|uniref:2-phosphosulfolactate phosphatase n=1 Tax=Methanocaldococcus villosus KIN24-T80 TaxID=1069083 RepID=N6VXE9_9EURY|nr:2-phosphosulfolactate phosphatase [Methanocaldococcus villosus]ENN95802.1 2-phosphosulfolactate phosphatase [Methanocaldococcus villosus KIN24-T80]
MFDHIYNGFLNQKIKDKVIVVDVLRASTTITTLLSIVDEVYITDSIERREKGIYIGERGGVKVKGFDFNNSPIEILKNRDIIEERYNNGEKIYLSTTNGTRVLRSLKAKEIFIGAIVNAKAVSEVGDATLIPCHRMGEFAIEDIVGCAYIAKYWGNDFGLANPELVINSEAAKHLKAIGYEGDVYFSIMENTYDIVGYYIKEDGKVVRYED